LLETFSGPTISTSREVFGAAGGHSFFGAVKFFANRGADAKKLDDELTILSIDSPWSTIGAITGYKLPKHPRLATVKSINKNVLSTFSSAKLGVEHHDRFFLIVTRDFAIRDAAESD
jgi:hypothetical protein